MRARFREDGGQKHSFHSRLQVLHRVLVPSQTGGILLAQSQFTFGMDGARERGRAWPGLMFMVMFNRGVITLTLS